MSRRLAALVIIGAAASMSSSCALDMTGDEPVRTQDQVDRIDDTGNLHPDASSREGLFPPTETGRMIRDHLEVIGLPAGDLETANERYRASLEGLRRRGTDAVAVLATAYKNIETSHYIERWEIVKTLADLQLTESYETLSQIAFAPVPPERSPNLHHFSTREQEVMIRLRAIQGLALLGKDNHQEAEEDLRRLALESNEVNSAIQLRAIKGYLRAGPDYDARVRYLKNELPKALHGVITLDVTPPEEFEARVKELATISDEDTTGDRAEEPSDEEGAPTVRKPKSEQQDDQ